MKEGDDVSTERQKDVLDRDRGKINVLKNRSLTGVIKAQRKQYDEQKRTAKSLSWLNGGAQNYGGRG